MRAGVFVFVLGVDAVERIAASVVRAGRRADDHPQLVPRLEDERGRLQIDADFRRPVWDEQLGTRAVAIARALDPLRHQHRAFGGMGRVRGIDIGHPHEHVDVGKFGRDPHVGVDASHDRAPVPQRVRVRREHDDVATSFDRALVPGPAGHGEGSAQLVRLLVPPSVGQGWEGSDVNGSCPLTLWGVGESARVNVK